MFWHLSAGRGCGILLADLKGSVNIRKIAASVSTANLVDADTSIFCDAKESDHRSFAEIKQ